MLLRRDPALLLTGTAPSSSRSAPSLSPRERHLEAPFQVPLFISAGQISRSGNNSSHEHMQVDAVVAKVTRYPDESAIQPPSAAVPEKDDADIDWIDCHRPRMSAETSSMIMVR